MSSHQLSTFNLKLGLQSATLFKMLFNALTLTALAACVNAAGRAIVTNHCTDPIYLWSVGNSISDQNIIYPESSYSEPFRTDPRSGGIALKISPIEGGISKPNVSQTIFAYNLDVNQVWYDMSDIFGDGFSGKSLTLKPTDATCESIVWASGEPPAGSQIKVCGAETDLELTFCTPPPPSQCLPAWSPCGTNAPPGETRVCCTHCIGNHHCVQAPGS